MKVPVILSWIITLILCLWVGALAFSLAVSSRSGPMLNGWDTNDTIALFTSLAVVAAAAQWYVALSARQTNRRQVRAYVSFDLNRNADRDPQPGKPYLLIFNCENHGDTPAIDLGFRGAIWQAKFDQNGNYPIFELDDEQDEKRGNLFPGEKWSDKGIGIVANTRSVYSAQQIEDVKRGTHAFVIALRIRYLDTFGESHETGEYWMIHYENSHTGPRRHVTMIPGKSWIS